MSNEQVLRSYVIRLGFKVDETSQKRMLEAAGKVSTMALGLGKSIVAAGVAFVAGVHRMAQSLDDLYFASRRTGASAGNLHALGFAAGQLGSTSEAAKASIESLARFMRNSPGGEGLIKSLGIDTRQANGELRDTVDIFNDLAKKFAGMEYYQANAYAQALGIDERTLMAMRDGSFQRLQDEQRQAMKDAGFDAGKAAELARAYEQALAKVQLRMKGVALAAAESMLPTFVKVTEAIDKNLEAMVKWASRYTTISDAIKAVSEGKAGAKPGEKPRTFWEWLLTPLKGTEGGLNPFAGARMTAARATAIAFFRASGWSPDQAAGLVANLMAESKLDPNAVGDSGKAYGIAQWHPDRQAAFKAWAGKDIRGSSLDEQLKFVQYELTRGAEQRAGALLRAAKSAQDAGSIVSRYYERPLAADEEAAKRGAAAVQLTQKTEINVHGASDPQQTASRVSAAQNDVNQQLVRNLRPAIQ